LGSEKKPAYMVRKIKEKHDKKRDEPRNLRKSTENHYALE